MSEQLLLLPQTLLPCDQETTEMLLRQQLSEERGQSSSIKRSDSLMMMEASLLSLLCEFCLSIYIYMF